MTGNSNSGGYNTKSGSAAKLPKGQRTMNDAVAEEKCRKRASTVFTAVAREKRQTKKKKETNAKAEEQGKEWRGKRRGRLQ